MPARILIATDLHQRAALYAALMRLRDEVKPDAVILGGDFFAWHGAATGWTNSSTDADAVRGGASGGFGADHLRAQQSRRRELVEFRDAGRSLRQTAPLRLNGSFEEIGSDGVIGFPCAMGQEEVFSEGEPLGGELYGYWLPRLLEEHGAAARGSFGSCMSRRQARGSLRPVRWWKDTHVGVMPSRSINRSWSFAATITSRRFGMTCGGSRSDARR